MNIKPVLIATGVVLILATLLGKWLGPEHDAFRVRLKAWWIMAVSFMIINLLHPALSLVGFASLSWIALREYLNRIAELPGWIRYLAYATIPLQYYWIYLGWYGMFIVFIPVYLFLFLPGGSVRQAALIHWGLMVTVFCLSHAAFLLKLPGGPGLMLFVVLLTELGEGCRLLLPERSWRPVILIILSLAAAWLLGPRLTPLSPNHILAAGICLGVMGELGQRRLRGLREALELNAGPLPPGQGGGLIRILTLTFTAPLFLHGYRYFYG
ncbi:hypothetical protein JST97_30060 [bacterium]|nr:hypothetical protein [bacterium]